MITWIIAIVAALIVVAIWAKYNGIITLNNRTQEAWSDIDVQLKRRHDLIPNLVETVKGYAKHESELFEKVTEARAAALSAKGIKEQSKAEGNLADALKSVFAVAENYPTLRASENFQKLQDELSDTENKLEAARRFYNGNVRDLNTSVQTFPGSLVAKMFKFQSKEFFQVDDASEKEAPKVGF